MGMRLVTCCFPSFYLEEGSRLAFGKLEGEDKLSIMNGTQYRRLAFPERMGHVRCDIVKRRWTVDGKCG
jgi:hypothetical protein